MEAFSNEDYLLLNTEFGKIYLSHGHMEAAKYGLRICCTRLRPWDAKQPYTGILMFPYLKISVDVFAESRQSYPAAERREGFLCHSLHISKAFRPPFTIGIRKNKRGAGAGGREKYFRRFSKNKILNDGIR